MTTKLKICGVTRLEDARYAAAAGADYLGFIQHERSPRYIEPSRVRELLEWVYGPSPIGVFVNSTADDVNRIADEAGFSMVQLHGEEPPFEVGQVERPVIKALRVRATDTPETLLRKARDYEDVVDYFLLDTYSDAAHGGTGETFDWSLAAALAQSHSLFLAGGIDASNVEHAVRSVHPYAIDVSSSLESAPGIKDFTLIDAFMHAFGAVNSDSFRSADR